MKPHLVIIGGGFAGLWATAAASEHRTTSGTDALDITLVTATPDLIIRPRLYEADLAVTVVPLEPIVTALDARGASQPFDVGRNGDVERVEVDTASPADVGHLDGTGTAPVHSTSTRTGESPTTVWL